MEQASAENFSVESTHHTLVINISVSVQHATDQAFESAAAAIRPHVPALSPVSLGHWMLRDMCIIYQSLGGDDTAASGAA